MNDMSAQQMTAQTLYKIGKAVRGSKKYSADEGSQLACVKLASQIQSLARGGGVRCGG